MVAKQRDDLRPGDGEPWPPPVELWMDFSEHSDEALVHLYQHGNAAERENAIRVIYNRYRQPMWRRARPLLRTNDDATDAVGDALEVVGKKLGSFEWREGTQSGQPLRAWLLKITARVARTAARILRMDAAGHASSLEGLEEVLAYVEAIIDGDTPPAATEADERQYARRFHKELKNLKNRDDRRILALSYFKRDKDGKRLKDEDIAKLFDITPVALRKRRQRAKEKLLRGIVGQFAGTGGEDNAP